MESGQFQIRAIIESLCESVEYLLLRSAMGIVGAGWDHLHQ
jgi:hypothetical protein